MIGWLSATGRPDLRVYHSRVSQYMAAPVKRLPEANPRGGRDNATAILFAKDTVRRSKLRHIDARMAWVEALRDETIVKFVKVGTEDNLADLNSKLLNPVRFKYLVDKILVQRWLPTQSSS